MQTNEYLNAEKNRDRTTYKSLATIPSVAAPMTEASNSISTLDAEDEGLLQSSTSVCAIDTLRRFHDQRREILATQGLSQVPTPQVCYHAQQCSQCLCFGAWMPAAHDEATDGQCSAVPPTTRPTPCPAGPSPAEPLVPYVRILPCPALTTQSFFPSCILVAALFSARMIFPVGDHHFGNGRIVPPFLPRYPRCRCVRIAWFGTANLGQQQPPLLVKRQGKFPLHQNIIT